MFEASLVESTHSIPGQSRWTVAVSIGIQAAIAALIVIIPLMHPESLRHMAFVPPQLIAPTPPVPPPPIRVLAHVAEASSAAPAAAPPLQMVMATSHSLADSFLRAQPGEEAPPGVATDVRMGSATGIPDGLGKLGTAPAGPVVTVAGPSRPVNISRGVSAGMLMAPIRPVYPRIAQVSHTEGTVIVQAIISKTGTIESARVVSGPALLQGAAIDAVRNAHYRPYKLNGEPTEVDTTINIVFRLGDS